MQLPASDNPTLLPTWAPLGLEGALTLWQPVLGMLTCSPAPRVAELERSQIFQSSGPKMRMRGTPTGGWQGGFLPTPRGRQKLQASLFPSTLRLEAAMPTIPVVFSRGSHWLRCHPPDGCQPRLPVLKKRGLPVSRPFPVGQVEREGTDSHRVKPTKGERQMGRDVWVRKVKLQVCVFCHCVCRKAGRQGAVLWGCQLAGV